MPRRVARNVFDVTRQDDGDKPTSGLESPEPGVSSLAGLMTRVGDEPSPRAPRGTSSLAPTQPKQVAPTPASPRLESTARGRGGRPPGERRGPARITPVPARVPTALYTAALELVKGRAKPSWGQLVSWTCQDDPTAVAAGVAALLEAAAGPRQLRGQNREGGPTTQVTARVTTDELAAIDAVRGQASNSDGAPVSRTMVIIAALEVATHSQRSTAP